MGTETRICAGCGKKIDPKNPNKYNADTSCLRNLGVKTIPNSGWHWHTNNKGERVRMYPICEKCDNKLETAFESKKKVVKGKVTVKKN